MGNTATKFRKALINGDELLAYQLYESNPQFKEALDPNTSYGEQYQHNTPLHYAARHAMTRLLRYADHSCLCAPVCFSKIMQHEFFCSVFVKVSSKEVM